MTNRIRVIALCLLLVLAPTLALAAITHKVKKKETLTSLARKYHVSVSDLKAANNIVTNHVKPGDLLVIPPRTDTVSADVAPASSETVYRVQRGDTLRKVSRKTGVSIADLKQFNDLRSSRPRLKPGQVLALKSDDAVSEPRQTIAHHSSSRRSELVSEGDALQSLEELTAVDPSRPVDLATTVEQARTKDQTTELKKTAYTFLGARYRFGGTSRRALDCSSFVQQVFRDLSVALPRTAREQYAVGDTVLASELQKGDLVFYHTYARFPSHVGIYLGGNKMIHASSRDRRVVISSINTPYYQARYIGAKRIAKINPDVFNIKELLSIAEVEHDEEAVANDTLAVVSE